MSKTERYDAYIICTSPRSGSTLLCRLLAVTGKAGKPDSHFHSPSVSEWMRYYEIAAGDYTDNHDLLTAIFRAARKRGTGSTGLFGLRLQRQSFEYFMQQLRVLVAGGSDVSDVDRIQNYFGKTLFIHLTRPNKLEQAISRVKATQSGLWHKAPDGTEIERKEAEQSLVYDASAIARHQSELTAMDAAWVSWFADQGIEPLHVNYDDLSSDPIGMLAKLLGLLGIDQEHARGIEVPVAKLADETNKRWATRFLAEQFKQNDNGS